MKSKVSEWLDLAGVDLAAAEKLADDEYLTPAVSFHAHQCIEKSFKAILEDNEKPVLKIHDLNRLYFELSGLVELDIDDEVLDDLSKLYVDSRYPSMTGLSAYGKPAIDDARRYIESAAYILSQVLKTVKK